MLYIRISYKRRGFLFAFCPYNFSSGNANLLYVNGSNNPGRINNNNVNNTNALRPSNFSRVDIFHILKILGNINGKVKPDRNVKVKS